uniref:Helicase ATP-binding domain-containing protein n=1 Tax=Acrobeloides nanus TaxID=290746 RepID=A0A914DQ70_9BILA
MASYLNRSNASSSSSGRQRKRKSIDIQSMNYESLKMTVLGLDKKPCSYDIKLPSGIKPYSVQKLMIMRVLQSYNNRLNSLIESPTGSGKTLSLLASTCAWLAEQKMKRHQSRDECPRHGIKRNYTQTQSTATNSSDISQNGFKQDVSMISDDGEKIPLRTKTLNRSAMEITLLEDFDEDFVDESEFKKPLPPMEEVEDFDEEDLSSFTESMLTGEKSDSTSKVPECTCEPRVVVYYGTRTHKQISQVVKEFARLPYGQDGTLKHTILASREHSCINERIRGIGGDLAAHCRDALNAQKLEQRCPYKDNMRGYDRSGQMRYFMRKSGAADVWDMEDLVNTLSVSRPQICPYFTSNRILAQDADIVFTPFNYILDPVVRRSSEIYVKNSIVIFDEGHNVEDVSREAASFEFRERDLYKAIQHLESKREKNTKTYGWEELRISLEDHNELLVGSNKDERFKMILNAIAGVMGKSKDEAPNILVEETLGHLRPSGFSIVPLEKFLYFMDFYSQKDYKNAESYRCNVNFILASRNDEIPATSMNRNRHYANGRSKGKSSYLSQKVVSDEDEETFQEIRTGYNAAVRLWCMIPSVAFMDAVSDARSVILASGTLCPTDTLTTELGLDFKLSMEGKQIIPNDQIFASVVSRGPSNVNLCAVYKNVSNEDCPFIAELAQVVLRTCQIVPKGVLCFMSSYRILELLYKHFQNNFGIWRELQRVKQVCIEPRRSAELTNVMDEYEAAVNNPRHYGSECTGALMLAVFRGKVSEGIDFTDDKARCVICVGIPFPNAMDDQVVEKRKYNDIHSRASKILNGNEWYIIQAYRALNQALGRCLRHINDWGALLLVDERFEQKSRIPDQKEFSKISKWVRENLCAYDNFASFEQNLKDFVEKREKKSIPQEEEKEVSVENNTLPPSRKNVRKIHPIFQ